jgi:hypothetical protein
MRGLRDDEIWGDDPVHPLPGVYGRIADGVIKMTGFLATKMAARKEEPKRRRTDSIEPLTMWSRNTGVTSRTMRTTRHPEEVIEAADGMTSVQLGASTQTEAA